MLRIVITNKRTFLNFGNAILHWFSHFESHGFCQFLFSLPKQFTKLCKKFRAVIKRPLSPLFECLVSKLNRFTDLFIFLLSYTLNGFTGGRVRSEEHTSELQ